MKPTYKTTYKYLWESNDTGDDWTCDAKITMGGLSIRLRAEEMRKGLWWWCVYAVKENLEYVCELETESYF